MQQAALLDGLSLDAFTFGQNGLSAAEADIGGREIAEALLNAPVIIVIDEGFDPRLEFAGQVRVLEQDAVLQRLVPALDLALGLRVAVCAADVLHPLAGKPIGQVTGDIARPIVGQQPRPVAHTRLRAA